MATITPQKRKGALVSYKFRVCVGRDAANKQIFRCTTWPVPQGLSPAKAAKAAKRAAEAWERETRATYAQDLLCPSKLGIEKCPASGQTLFPLYVIHGFPFVLRMEPTNQRQSPFMRTPCETL